MLQVRIDMSDYIENSSLGDSEIQGLKSLILDRLADGFQEQWINQVNSNLHSTRAEYMKGMYIDRPDDDSVVFGLNERESKLAVALELGKDAFDEKIGFFNSSKKTMKKDGKGWYITIPFRHANPTALGESPAFTSVMPLSVYKLAKNANKGLTINQLPENEQIKGIRPGINSGNTSFPAYKHKTARYQGLVRIVNPVDNRGGYFTFRRVSNLSDANSWIHPGFTPRGLLRKALDSTDIVSIAMRAKVDYFSGV